MDSKQIDISKEIDIINRIFENFKILFQLTSPDLSNFLTSFLIKADAYKKNSLDKLNFNSSVHHKYFKQRYKLNSFCATV